MKPGHDGVLDAALLRGTALPAADLPRSYPRQEEAAES
jgi:hypothetical protein